ncbi:MAG TPA: fimbrial protein [Aurantimonas sp.]|jgi:hypothetical protein|nr:fimbrial protein [Aurantimonas sp.]
MTIRDEDEAEEPLDPAVERLRRKMVRLLAVSIGVMMIGVMAVLAAVVYKAVGSGGPAATEGAEIALALPAGAEILSLSLDGDRALVHASVAEANRMYLISLADGRILATYTLGEGG